jgi:hypothetical protein
MEDRHDPTVGGVIIFGIALESLAIDFPDVPLHRIRAALIDEHDAITGGEPILIPLAAASGAREVLERENR